MTNGTILLGGWRHCQAWIHRSRNSRFGRNIMGGTASSAQWNVVFIVDIVVTAVVISWKITAIVIIGNVNIHPLIVIMLMLLMKVLLRLP